MPTKIVALGGSFTFSLSDSNAALTAAALTVTDINGQVYLAAVPMVIDSPSAAHESLTALPGAGIYQAHVDFIDNGASLGADWTLAYGESSSVGQGSSGGGSQPVNPVFADLEFTVGAPAASLSDQAMPLVSGSDGFIHIPVSVTTAAGVAIDLTQQLNGAYVYPVSICPTLTPAPLAASYQAGDWIAENGVTYARLQVGQTNPLAAGNYLMYVQIAGTYRLLALGLFPVVA